MANEDADPESRTEDPTAKRIEEARRRGDVPKSPELVTWLMLGGTAGVLALLGPYIERTATGSVGRRSPELLRLGNEDLAEVVAPNAVGRLLGEVEALAEADLRERLEAAECWSVCRHHDRYPPGLRDAADGPRALIGRGDRELLCDLEPEAAVTIVGSRRATSYGREVARELGREVSTAGLVVVSGLAFGIDACAHRGAVDTGGRTLAVLGCGPDTSYPAAHRALWRKVVLTVEPAAPVAVRLNFTVGFTNEAPLAMGPGTVSFTVVPLMATE